MQYTEQELAQLIKDVESAFTDHLAKSEFTASNVAPELIKAEEEPSDEKEEKEKAPESDDKEPQDEEQEASEEAPQEGAPAEEAIEAEHQEEAPEAQADEASGYDQEDIEHLDKMYMSMSKAELLAHHDSCVRALDAIGAEHVHAAPPAAEEVDKCGDMSMAKSEEVMAKPEETTETVKEIELAKSEAASQKAKAEELQKSLDAVQEFLTKLVRKAPEGKAITSLEQVAKSEAPVEEKTLTKSEIDAILLRKTADPRLTKSDREAINSYYLNNKNLNTISHLLK